MPADRLFHPKLGHSAKVTSLSHLEARVWTQFILSADDFGVMPFTAIQVQADNLALARESIHVVHAALERLVAVGLVRTFTHQGVTFLYQHDWQDWQKVEYPRVSIRPKPTGEAFKACSVKTRKLLSKHPGGVAKGLPKVPRISAKGLPSNARARGRETAHGIRQTANGSTGEHERGARFRPRGTEIERAQKWRAAVGRCPHDPTCPNYDACLGAQIRIWRAEQEREPEVAAS
jgi:hypothetical protein